MFRTTLIIVLTAIALSSNLVLGQLNDSPATHVVPRDNCISPSDRYCPWCWQNITASQNTSECHLLFQMPKDITPGTTAANTDGTMAILSNNFTQLYAWARVNMVDGQGSVNFDIRLPGLQKLRNASASVTMGAINRTNPVFPVGQFPNWRPIFSLYLPFRQAPESIPIYWNDDNDQVWNQPVPFSDVVDGVEVLFYHALFRCIYD